LNIYKPLSATKGNSSKDTPSPLCVPYLTKFNSLLC